ncbi:hypothetical protein scyTo_0013451 [Scyliorhinus torazame]|uniref:Rhodanese domain-containing protein n=1 Tax=Scyliorhinus torazame TaxID=75743 RepID=A0A401NWZ3_SCYTO|nr:hypothetical protein [Scyliorhinus torazame]
MAGIIFCEATELYNLFNQCTKYSRLTEPIYLYLVDVRSKSEYDESHVITAKRARTDVDGNYLLPQDIELECVKYCVVYDGHTKSSDEVGPAIQYAMLLEVVSRQPIRILNGGYEYFSACYPFFRTQMLFYLPQELDAFEPYPIEIIPAKLYMGNFKQATNQQVQKDLKFKAYLNLCKAKEIIITDKNIASILHIPSSEETDLYYHFPMICNFLAGQLIERIINTFHCKQDEVLYICENNPLKKFVSRNTNCTCVTRKSFMENIYTRVKHIVVDEAQNFRTEDGKGIKSVYGIIRALVAE